MYISYKNNKKIFLDGYNKQFTHVGVRQNMIETLQSKIFSNVEYHHTLLFLKVEVHNMQALAGGNSLLVVKCFSS